MHQYRFIFSIYFCCLGSSSHFSSFIILFSKYFSLSLSYLSLFLFISIISSYSREYSFFTLSFNSLLLSIYSLCLRC